MGLLPAAAMLVHQLRFMLAFGSDSGLELQRQGHAYLHSLVPWIVLLIGLAVGAFLRRLGRALGGEASLQRSLSFGGLWMVCACSLVAIYVVQEFLEGLFATGHPTGLAGIFGYGGWWSIPASLYVGFLLAALFLGARRVLTELAARCRRFAPLPARRAAGAPGPCEVLVPRLAPLAGGWSGRGPPS